MNIYPEWADQNSINMLEKSYLDDKEGGLLKHYRRMAKTAAKWAPKDGTDWESKFFEMMWKGWVSNSTPAYNLGNRKRGMPVSCSSSYVPDSLDGIYQAKHEIAMLTKYGFGCGAHLDDVRGRGEMVSGLFPSTGVLPIIKGLVEDMNYVCQGAQRRGSIASYLDVEHKDFKEVVKHLETEPKDLNIGWNFRNSFKDRMNAGDKDLMERWQSVMFCRYVSGRGYMNFIDDQEKYLPKWYKDAGLTLKGSNLCSEIMLPTDKDHTFNCTLGSLNVSKYDEWKDTDVVFTLAVYLDCINSEFIDMADGKPGMERIVRFAKKFRPIGIGQMGSHTYMQDNMMPFGGFQSVMFTVEVAKKINQGSLRASQYLAEHLGEPEGLKGTGLRLGSRVSVAPTKSSSNIMGGVSQGIDQMFGACFSEPLSTGYVIRDNPAFVRLLKKKGMFSRELMNDIAMNHNGSVQHLDFLSDDEKAVFRAVWEVNPMDVLKLAAIRQKHMDQMQSINLVFGPHMTPEDIALVHQEALENPDILSLYYMRRVTEDKGGSGLKQDLSECLACE